MSIRIQFWFLLFYCFSSNLGITQEATFADSTFHLSRIQSSHFTGIQSLKTPQIRSSSIYSVDFTSFNIGLISDPFLLVQGQLPGVQIYNRGGNPNTPSIVRMRGLSGIAQPQGPLIVIDGIAQASILSIDPLEIGKMTFLNDAASQAIYGMRAANGVVLIDSKSFSSVRDTTLLSFQVQMGLSQAIADPGLMTAEEFRAAGGYDLGGSTDWIDEITRSTGSQVAGLSYFKRTGQTSIKMNGHFRRINGILSGSDFESINIRSSVDGQLGSDRFQYHAQLSLTDSDREIGFQEAFRYAQSFNPTAPKDGRDAPFTFNESLFGGYYENLGLFDSFNPLAIVDLNKRIGSDRMITSAFHLSYHVGVFSQINFRLSYQDHFNNFRTYYSPNSHFNGNAWRTDPIDKGSLILRDTDNNFSTFELYLTEARSIGSAQFSYTAGGSYFNGKYLETARQIRGLNQSSLIETERIEDLPPLPETSTTTPGLC